MTVVSLAVAAASAVFLLLAARWLLVLRRAALDARLALSPFQKLVAAAPIGYTLLCFAAAGALGERFTLVSAEPDSTAVLPIVGEVSRAFALWLTGLLTGLALATPPVVVFTVESYFGERLPALVPLGRRAVWSMFTGVSAGAAARAPAPEEQVDAEWKRLLA